MLFLKKCQSKLLTCFVILNLIGASAAEIFTLSYAAYAIGTTLVGWYSWDKVKENTYCRYAECCIAQDVPYDLFKLHNSLSSKLFGQPLAMELYNILAAHKEAMYSDTKKNSKALVVSLHGWSGVGKNYAVRMIAESLYKSGMASSYVKLFMGNKDFDCKDIHNTKRKLLEDVKKVVQQCPKSLIIFDEIHDMCPTILDAVKPMLDHHHAVDGVDFRDSIFIFISNVGGQEISDTLLELYSKGVKRKDIEFHMFEPVLRRTAFKSGGFEKAATITHNLIDHYIPFLPLEQHHVEQCAKSEFYANDVLRPTEEMMKDAFSVITYGPTEDQPIFANNGCKRFPRHIPYVIQKHKKSKEEL